MIQALAVLVIGYGVLVAFLFVFQHKFIYHPDGTRPDPSLYGVPEMVPVTLTTGDGLQLLAWWRPPVSADAPVMVYFHGNGGHIGYRGHKLRRYLDAGWGVLLPAWRGYSGNPGHPSEAGLYADGRAALDFLAAHGTPADRVVLYGESLGSAVVVQMALERGARAMVLEAPFTSIADVAAGRFPFVPVRLLIRHRFESVKKISRLRLPLMVIHGEGDSVVPIAFGRRLFEAANAPKTAKFLPTAGHNDLYEHGAARFALSFIQQLDQR